MNTDRDTAINQRLRQLRAILNLSQVKFSKGIFLKSSGYYADIETGKHEVNERIIELVSSVYGVNKIWLKTGEGEIFEADKKSIDPLFEEMTILFNELNPDFKSYTLTQIKSLIKLQNKKDEDK
jgi:transcriptional regulator with XRE-family HTH domain